ncbi:integral membrane sensor signal transduction histidine kinase [Pseudofrankia inefficax]|uniref:Integral membrane sensor signal transduction histidine kinase n=2 Tax=Pseudofrankia inefficax (strain DSM 45817 / CECT 9037 / DDB 130130 / EuI1c) TaxID=298654 RepID=E3J1M9_PSEI1|nr:integral membrane sensor signal transduction histidine kinase [Pseudofrankia inefficax]
MTVMRGVHLPERAVGPGAALGCGAAGQTGEVTWQERSDRLARLLMLPMLAISTLLAVITLPAVRTQHTRVEIGVAVVAVAALWSTGLIRYPVTGVPPRSRWLVFGVHLTLAATLVWLNPWYGVFAFTGYFLADELGGHARRVGFVAVALVSAASQAAGYPNGSNAHTVTYLIMAAFNVVAVLLMVNLTNRVMEQNTERGRMIAELAETNRQLQASMDENAGLHAQLLTQAREAGVAEERGRLAGEIHDTLAQGLAGILTQLEAARRAHADPAEWSRHIELADGLARANLTEARRSVRALRPEQLEQASLSDALADLARDWSRRTQVPAEAVTTGVPVRAPAETEMAVFRIAQEALANVARHAHATRARVTLSYLDDTLLLDVADDGAGFHPGAGAPPARFGVTGMRRRAESVAGTLSIESAPGDGTTVNAVFPLTPTPAEATPGTGGAARETASVEVAR